MRDKENVQLAEWVHGDERAGEMWMRHAGLSGRRDSSDLHGLLVGGFGHRICRACCPKLAGTFAGSSRRTSWVAEGGSRRRARLDAWQGGQLTAAKRRKERIG